MVFLSMSLLICKLTINKILDWNWKTLPHFKFVAENIICLYSNILTIPGSKIVKYIFNDQSWRINIFCVSQVRFETNKEKWFNKNDLALTSAAKNQELSIELYYDRLLCLLSFTIFLIYLEKIKNKKARLRSTDALTQFTSSLFHLCHTVGK